MTFLRATYMIVLVNKISDQYQVSLILYSHLRLRDGGGGWWLWGWWGRSMRLVILMSVELDTNYTNNHYIVPFHTSLIQT